VVERVSLELRNMEALHGFPHSTVDAQTGAGSDKANVDLTLNVRDG
jgi:hypothetical protein